MSRVRITAVLDEETNRYLERIAAQEFRPKSSTVAMLIRQEAARRGMLGRAPTLVADAARRE